MDSEIHDLVEQQGVQAVDDSGRLGLLLPELLVHQRAQRARHDGRGGRVAAAHAALRRADADAPRRPRADARGRRRPRHAPVPPPRPARPRSSRSTASRSQTGRPGRRAPFDLSHEVFTIQSLPGQTVDAILRWTGKGLGWDIYGHKTGRRQRLRRRPGPEGLDPTTQRVLRRPPQAAAGGAARGAGADQRAVLQRQPVPRPGGPDAPGRRRAQPERRLHLHVALPQREGDHQLRHLPGRNDDDARRRASGHDRSRSPSTQGAQAMSIITLSRRVHQMRTNDSVGMRSLWSVVVAARRARTDGRRARRPSPPCTSSRRR